MHSDRFGDVQELCFETAKHSEMGCAILLEGLFVDAPESRFRVRKFRIWGAMWSISYFSEISFSCSNLQIWAVLSCKNFVSWCSGIAFSVCESFEYEQCFPAVRLICWFSGIAFLCCQTVRYGQRYPARGLICWCSGIEYSCCETIRYVHCRHEITSFSRS